MRLILPLTIIIALVLGKILGWAVAVLNGYVSILNQAF